MRIAVLRRARNDSDRPGLHGVARVGRSTSALAERIRPGDIAIVDHLDLDKSRAEAFVRRRVGAVVNASPSSSGRYPNLGPQVLVAAGIPLVDAAGPEVLSVVHDGERLRLDGDRLYRGDDVVAVGIRQSETTVRLAMTAAHARLGVQLEAFAGNTIEYIRADRDLLLDGAGIPALLPEFGGRPAVLVMAAAGCRADLSQLRGYVKDRRPVLVGVGAGADVLLDAGYRPDVVVGEPAALSDAALRSGAAVVVHVQRDGNVRGLSRVEEHCTEHVVLPAGGTDEDVALLLADDKGADPIVTVGAPASLIEFFDQGRAGMASTFVARLRVGRKLVDARTVGNLHRPGPALWPLLLLLVIAVIAVGVGVHLTPRDSAFLAVIGGWFDSLLSWTAEIA